MEILGFGMAILIGLSLGLIGGGGSILTVPVLVYIVGINPIKSITYSLFVVGSTALIGAVHYYRKNMVNLKASLTFAIPSFTAVFLTRQFLLPLLPDTFFHLGSLEISKGLFLMLAFAVLMIFSASSMISQTQQFRKLCKNCDENNFSYPFIFAEGIVVGLLTGFVGAGGGFLIIPALVLFAGLPMKRAVGTSLFIIAINSLIGFSTDILGGTSVDWSFLGSFSSFAFAGIIIGTFLSKKIEGTSLRPAFGWFTLSIGAFIIIKEIITGI